MNTRRATRAATLAATLMALASVGCGGGDKLEGSAGENLSIDFDRVDVAFQMNQYLIVEFVSSAEEEVVEVTIDTFAVGCEIVEGADLDFPTCAFLDRTTLDGTSFDCVASGRFVIFQWGDVGDTISGEFDVLFDNGLTLSGEFTATLVER